MAEFTDPQTILVYFSPGCSSCSELVPIFRTWPNALADDTDIQPVFFGTRAQFEAIGEPYEALLDVAWYDPIGATMRGVGVAATPGAVLIDSEHPGGTDACIGAPAISDLVMRHVTVGVTAPTSRGAAVAAPDISGYFSRGE